MSEYLEQTLSTSLAFTVKVGFSMLFIGHLYKTSLLTCWWNPCPSHTVFSSSRQWCFVPITTAGIRMLPPVPGKHGLAAYITFKNLEEAEPNKTNLPKLMAVKIVEVQHVVLGVGIVRNSRRKGNQCQIFWPFWVPFFWLPGQVGGGEHAQQSIERSSWTAVAWITDSGCSGVGEWHVKACTWKTEKLGLWVLEIKKLWLRGVVFTKPLWHLEGGCWSCEGNWAMTMWAKVSWLWSDWVLRPLLL